MNIKRFVSKKCIGHNLDGTFSYYEGVAEMEDGSLETVYSDAEMVNGQSYESHWYSDRPNVELPITDALDLHIFDLKKMDG
jgi:hypothetical protein